MNYPDYFSEVFKNPNLNCYKADGNISRNTVVKNSLCYFSLPVVSRNGDHWLIYPNYDTYKKSK